MIIGSKTLRESSDIDIVQAFHQRVSEVGETFAALTLLLALMRLLVR